jgi:hypothetical protein
VNDPSMIAPPSIIGLLTYNVVEAGIVSTPVDKICKSPTNNISFSGNI